MGEKDKTDEIETTPEMIEAGAIHLDRYDLARGADDEVTLRRIFRAMYRARQREPR